MTRQPDWEEKLHNVKNSMGLHHCEQLCLFCADTILTLKIISRVKRTSACKDSEIPGGKSSSAFEEILRTFPCPPNKNSQFTQWFQLAEVQGLLQAAFKELPGGALSISQGELQNISERVKYNAHIMKDCNAKLCGIHCLGRALFPDVLPRDAVRVCSDHNAERIMRGRCMRWVAVEDIANYTGLKDLRWNVTDRTHTPFVLPREERRQLFEKENEEACVCRKCTTEYDAEINPMKCSTNGCSERIPSDDRALLPCEQCGAINEAQLLKYRAFVKAHQKNFYTLIAQEIDDSDNTGRLINRLKTKLIGELDKLDVLQPEAHLRFVCGWALTDVYEEQQRFKEAWSMYKGCIECIRKILPVFHPERTNYLGYASHFVEKWLNALEVKCQIRGQASTDCPVELIEAIVLSIEYTEEAIKIYNTLYGSEAYLVAVMTAHCNQLKRYGLNRNSLDD
ncbi:uncharacterized protein LOC129601251 isoform X2 [Paramacrobiotus metropolitanus]|nr:uncharacterized protein LOC129601251 isoform X2 [Paramacrobiotus metropolitanus]